MAVVAPMPLTKNSFNNRFHHNPARRGSDLSPTLNRSATSGSIGSMSLTGGHHSLSMNNSSRQQAPLTLEQIAAEIQLRLSTSPSADFSYVDDKLYGESSNSIPYLHNRSRSLPNFSPSRSKSSLSPKTPLRKTKSVRFADTQGLPLVEAVHQLTRKDSSYTANKIVPYDESEDILSEKPLIVAAPALRNGNGVSTHKSNPGPTKSNPPPLTAPPKGSPRTTRRQDSLLNPPHKHTFMFTQPSLQPDFFERVKTDNVVLESVRQEPRSLHGIVRVQNVAYNKEVVIRWTHDSWRTSHDTCCVFCSNDGDTDRFAFELPINGDDVSFCIRYRVEGGEYWDNNQGSNYTVTSASSR